ncbi:MAG: transporter substrate-binding domain-containing protein, partial [Clostridia bacterium]|nr:transporter substrate-binding domain-containing protein [Clostridia bacterium]
MQSAKNRKWISFLLLMLAVLLPLVGLSDEKERKTVRVGWYDSSFCYFDRFGRRCGIDYEYQQKISAYTGWSYEYVEGSWPTLFQMLKDGEIDLLSDVSYNPERVAYMFFPDLPMGSESYYIYIDAGNTAITADNPQSLNGKRIGVNKGSVQEGFLGEWMERNRVTLEIIPMVEDEGTAMEMVTRGEIDGFASIYSFSSEQKVVPLCRIGSSDYYYAVNRNRPDLLAELNVALAGIQDEDPFFMERLNEERMYTIRTNTYLNADQESWIQEHGSIRVGYREDYLPFCQTNRDTGELTGALKDYLVHAESSLRSARIHFETFPYETTEKAIEALKAGEIDCVFPVYLNSYDAEQMGIRLTNAAMKTELNVVMPVSDIQGLSKDSHLVIAGREGDLNLDTFVKDRFPESRVDRYDSGEAVLSAVRAGKADCAILSNYRIFSLEEQLSSYKLITIPTGETMPLSFAVNWDDRECYFILNKTVVMTKIEEMDSALASYMRSDRKVTFALFLRDNWISVMVILSVIFFIIIVLLLQKLRAEKMSNERQRMMEEGLRRELQQKEQLNTAMNMVYKDPLTGVKSKHAYNEAEERMDRRIEEGTVSRFSVAVFDLNDLKRINDTQGHEAGDEYIRTACRLICTHFKHSPVFRIGGDEFVAILEGVDYENQREILEQFEKQILGNLENEKIVV